MNATPEHFEELIYDVEFQSVRDWKNEHPGCKAVAYFPVYAPVELIHAAGMLPVGLHGAGDRLDIQHADARFGSFICSIAKTTLELAMTERLAVFDAMFFSSICDTARNLCFIMQRNFSAIHCDFIHLPHNPTTDASIDFLASEYRRVLVDLERISGNKVRPEDLLASIEVYNHNRELTRQLFDLRSSSPELLSSAELYSIVRAGDFLPVEQHNLLLQHLRDAVPSRSGKRRDSIRVVIEGSFCEQPPLELIRLVERAGCYIVDDDFALGRRWFRGAIPTTGDPIESLATAYRDESVYSSVRHDFRRPRSRGLIEKVRERSADAVIMLIAKFCEPAEFDYVLFKKELESEGVPHLLVEFEEKLFTFDRIQNEVETFVESLMFV